MTSNHDSHHHCHRRVIVPRIGPSVLAADLSDLLSVSKKLVDDGADYLHLDIMDNVFVNNFTFGHPVVKCLRNSLRSKYNLEPEFDMHMMVQEPRKLISPMAEAGGNIYTFHYETTKTHEECKELFRLIRESGMKVGLAIKPETPVEHILPLVPLTDVILVMTVNPGFGSQSFMEDMMPKVSLLRKTFPELDIGVDGGVGPKTIESVAEAGANMIVSGSALTNLGVDAKAVMQDMKDILRRRLSGNN